MFKRSFSRWNRVKSSKWKLRSYAKTNLRNTSITWCLIVIEFLRKIKVVWWKRIVVSQFQGYRSIRQSAQICKVLTSSEDSKFAIFPKNGKWQLLYARGKPQCELISWIWVDPSTGMKKGGLCRCIVRARISIKCLGGEQSPILWSNLDGVLQFLIFWCSCSLVKFQESSKFSRKSAFFEIVRWDR